MLFPIRAAASELRVGVMPISGDAPPDLRARATQILMDTLAAMRGISVVSFAKLDLVVGEKAKQALEACTDDRCIVEKTSAVRTDRIVAGSLDLEGDRTVLRLRAVRTSSSAETIARVTREVGDLAAVVSQSALDLFPEQAKDTVGTLEIRGAIPGAEIIVDGRMSATVPLEATDPDAPALLRLSPGPHEIVVRAPGHFPATERAEVLAGQRTRLEIDLEKNRSSGPLILGGIGAASVIAAAILGGVVRGKANDWEEACPAGMPCAFGFTRDRYESDRQAIEQGRTVANVLYGIGGAALIAGVTWFFLDPGSDPE